MKEEIINHYKATCKRKKINKKSTFIDFFQIANEKDIEAIMELENFNKADGLSSKFVQKWIDSIAVRINLLTHLNIDFIEEYKKNAVHQESRED